MIFKLVGWPKRLLRGKHFADPSPFGVATVGETISMQSIVYG